ncbi:hypothetical protein ABTZ58_36925 [Streptomyces sp. NPDC094143]|uniref:hypothetical protein n=1 Tax=Streptomyces sp. NPDC094143 TaxID=3155310 RepID=UPI00331CC46E
MVFDNIFKSAIDGAGLFSVGTDRPGPEPGAGVDFEDVDAGAYDDTRTGLFSNAIHGASSRAKVVQEQSPQARVILGLLGSFIQTTQASASTQARYAGEASSVSTAASSGMQDARSKIPENEGLKRNEDLKDRPARSEYATPPKAPDTPKAPPAPAAAKAAAETPQTLGETSKTEATVKDSSGSP